MSENFDELRNMLVTFRVSELQMLLGYAGRNKTGRKNQLQQRAFELLRARSHPIQQKIRELYKTIQQSGALNQIQNTSPTTTPTGTPSPNMPQHHSNMNQANNMGRYVMDTRALNVRDQLNNTGYPMTRAATMYNQNNLYSGHYQSQYTSTRSMNPNLNMMMQPNNYPVHPDVEFKRLPFFDVIAELIKPSTLLPQSTTKIQECNFVFHLTPHQATDIAASRDVRHNTRADYFKQIQMRFCLMETSCKQEDFFPPGLIVKVNGKQCPLPNPIPTNKPGVEAKRPPRPVNITQYVKLSPTTANSINVQWVHEYGSAYAVTVALVHKRTSSDLLTRMKTRGSKASDHTRGIIKEKLNDDGDNEIATTCLRVSLMCPLGKMRMSNPCRAKTCQHLQCFDASLYLQMNERKPTWNCPVCDKPAVYEDLDIDGYFQDVLNSSILDSETKEIQLHKDGSWSVQSKVKPVPVAKPKAVPLDDSVEIILDDNDTIVPGNATSSTDKLKEECESAASNSGVNPDKSVVDLTLSDSDDDEPLAKRRNVAAKPDSTIKFSDTTSISSSSNQSRVSVTPGPSSVSSSGYPASPGAVIALDSPSPPSSPQPQNTQQQQQNMNSTSSSSSTAPPPLGGTTGSAAEPPSSCMMSNGSSSAPSNLFTPAMPYLNMESNETGNANMNCYN